MPQCWAPTVPVISVVQWPHWALDFVVPHGQCLASEALYPNPGPVPSSRFPTWWTGPQHLFWGSVSLSFLENAEVVGRWVLGLKFCPAEAPLSRFCANGASGALRPSDGSRAWRAGPEVRAAHTEALNTSPVARLPYTAQERGMGILAGGSQGRNQLALEKAMKSPPKVLKESAPPRPWSKRMKAAPQDLSCPVTPSFLSHRLPLVSLLLGPYR